LFFDTNVDLLEGEGARAWQRGHSKDQRPDLKQMVVGMVLGPERQPGLQRTLAGETRPT